MSEPSLPAAMRPLLKSFRQVLRRVLLVSDFLLQPVDVAGPDVARGLAQFLTAEGKRVAILEPGTSEIAARDLVVDILDVAKDKSIDIVMVIGSDNPPPSMHTGFRLLNQARDRIVKVLNRPLLWCGPSSFLVMSQGEAPDFWSIRMIDVFVRPEAEPQPSAHAVESGSPEIMQLRTEYQETKSQGALEITAYAAKRFVEALLAENLLDEASRTIEEAITDAEKGAPNTVLGELVRLSARVQRARGDDMSAAATLGALVGRKEMGDYTRLLAQLDLAKLLEDSGRLDSAERVYRDALALARGLSDIETEAQALIGAYGIAARTGRSQDAEKPLADAAEMARRVGNKSLVAAALAAQSLLALETFDSPKAERKLDEARRELTRVTSRSEAASRPHVDKTTPVDVVIFTAVKSELDAVLAVGTKDGEAWLELRDLGGFRYYRREIRRARDSFVVAAAWIGEMGGRSTAIRAQQLLTELSPSCLAMCGICAGDRNKVALGDIIVADRLFAWDEGKRIAEPGKEEAFYHSLRSFDLEATWRMDAAFLGDELDLAKWSKGRPPSKTSQRNWFLFTLAAFEAKQGPGPAAHPDRKQRCPGWTTVFDELLAEALITIGDDASLSLTTKGRNVVAQHKMRFPDGLPEDPPLRVHVGAVATVAAVIEDPGIFKRMQQVVRSTWGLEMEGAALGEVAERFSKRAILVKAVQDFADGTKDDSFRAFGCRISAEFLFAFLEKHFEPTRDERLDRRLEMLEFDFDREPEHPFSAKVERAARIRYPEAVLTKHRVEAPFVGLMQLEIPTGVFSGMQLVAVLDQGVTPELVQQFALLERPFRDDYPPLRSTIVYRGEAASPELSAEARRKGIHLETFYAYQALFDLTKYLEWQTARLVADPIYPPAMYVDPPATYEVQGSRDLTRVDNALQYLLDLLRTAEQPRFALVIGEFGAGKTFLLHELARRMVVEKHPVWPVLVEMHRLEKQPDLPALLGAHFANADVPGYSFKAFQYMLNEGRIALLFDGFDELAGQVTYDAVTKHFDTVLSAAQGERAKVVLSSRRQHFLSEAQLKEGVEQSRIKLALAEEAKKVPGFRLVMLEKFEALQIKQYLFNVLGDQRQADERYALINDVKDLLGLSHNPRMLGFISRIPETSLREAKRKQGTITAAGLYDLLVNEWLDFEHKRSLRLSARKGISREALHQGIGRLAVNMWQSRIKQVQVDQIRDVVAAAMVELKEPALDPNVLAHMFGSGSLLVRDADGRFSFVHRSVMEWFVAREAATQVQEHGDSALLAVDELSPLMADFFSAMATREKAIEWARGKFFAREKGVVAKTATLVLQRLGESFQSVDFSNQDLRGKDFSGVDWRGADLRGANLESATLVGADLSGANLEGVSLYRANLKKVKLIGAQLANANLRITQLLGADLTDAKGLDSVELFRTNFAGAKVPEGFDSETKDPFGVPSTVWQTDLMLSNAAASCLGVAFDGTGELLAAGFSDATVRVFDAHTGEQLRVLAEHTAPVKSVMFSPDGRTIASGSYDNTVRLWDARSGRCFRALKGHVGMVKDVAFSPDGKIIASGSEDKTVRLSDVSSGRTMHVLEGHAHYVLSVSFSPDGKIIASGSHDRTVRLSDVISGQLLRVLQGHRKWVQSVAFGPDGKTLVSGSSDKTLRLWDVTSRRPPHVFLGHIAPVVCVAFSSDGSTIVSGSSDNILRLWDVRSGRYLRTLEGHGQSVLSVAFSPDGKTLASGSADKTIRIWDVATGRCIRVIDSSETAPWYVVNLCRLEQSDIEEYLPHLAAAAKT